MRQPGSASDPLWYKDAIIYEAHVRTFFDSNDDGIGDFEGLTRKLDYLQGLGVTAIWLLPFYPSPLRDDGYDIAHYEGIHPSYGTLRDFKHFLREAHERGLQVITELVINHTSDQHPWFQAARRAPPGSSKRTYYVWSDTDKKYPDVRIVFTDSEANNWTWDPEAKAYYWHRFFTHQPDLNYDNPRVRRAMMKVMRFWLTMGVDGLRLDAVPYLIEREGTDCENLPETHEILRALRRELDERYENRMLLAESNQWPAEVRPYFGDGDESHMAFHFPLMPRMFMALQQEDRHPLVDILRQTPDIPDICQWALFLRNHDELTLEMVTDEERDYMYQAYAADPQMRLNIGIRRRLAPLMENNRRRIELLNSLLFSLPGTPVIYYGDEIGMGDNIYLGDRNGVRTPMQWTGDRNGGFSRADPARLFAPPIMDPVYGYQAINVEAQERSPWSLLQWMKRLIALRKQHKTFGRGSLDFLHPQNRKVLAYIRRHEDEIILAVANLSRTVQPASADLREFAGLTPVEMLGRTEFPRIGEQPYFLTLGPYASYWFLLQRTPTPIAVRVAPQRIEEVEPAPALLAGPTWDTLLDGNLRTLLEKEHLAPFLFRQRWFAGKARTVKATRIVDWTLLRKGRQPAFLAVVAIDYADGGRDRYFVPLAVTNEAEATPIIENAPGAIVARVTGARKGVIHDAWLDDASGEALLAAIEARREFATRRGIIRAFPADGATAPRRTASTGDGVLKITRGSAEQSNSSLVYGDRFVLKLFRRLEPGPNPDVEVSAHLSGKVGFPAVPRLAGAIEYRQPGEEPMALAMLQAWVPSQANGWDFTIDELDRYFERAASLDRPPASLGAASPTRLLATEILPVIMETIGGYLESAATLGRRTAELHMALASDEGDPAFAPEAITPEDLSEFARAMTAHATQVLDTLEREHNRLSALTARRAAVVLNQRKTLLRRLNSLASLPLRAAKIRIHGDYHLGQVLWAQGDFVIIDFEGEPARPLAYRRTKRLALEDVAGMIRSFNYAAYAGLFAFTADRPNDLTRLEPWADVWHTWTAAVFLRAYLSTAAGGPFLPADPAHVEAVLQVLLLDKALYEMHYELNTRPDWVRIPLRGLLSLLEAQGS